MLIWLFRYLKGFVRIRVLGYSPERFLNLCKARRIVLWDLQNVGNEYEMNLSIRDFRKIRPLVKKARAHVTVTERHGLPFFLHRNRKRKMFPVGMLACCMLLYVLSLFIWDIRIEGNLAAVPTYCLPIWRRSRSSTVCENAMWTARKSRPCFGFIFPI